MKLQKKQLGLVIVILVIGFNVCDYFNVKNKLSRGDIEICSKKFILNNPKTNKEIADKYCACAIEMLGDTYKGSPVEAEVILENEKLILQYCFDKAAE